MSCLAYHRLGLLIAAPPPPATRLAGWRERATQTAQACPKPVPRSRPSRRPISRLPYRSRHRRVSTPCWCAPASTARSTRSTSRRASSSKAARWSRSTRAIQAASTRPRPRSSRTKPISPTPISTRSGDAARRICHPPAADTQRPPWRNRPRRRRRRSRHFNADPAGLRHGEGADLGTSASGGRRRQHRQRVHPDRHRRIAQIADRGDLTAPEDQFPTSAQNAARRQRSLRCRLTARRCSPPARWR